MPKTQVEIFAEVDGTAPLVEWMDKLKPVAQDKCHAKIKLLADYGYELRRPNADFLRDGIYELRIKHEGVQYRILYFFHDGDVVLSHGLQKESKVPPGEIDCAIDRKILFTVNPQKHTYEVEEESEDDNEKKTDN